MTGKPPVLSIREILELSADEYDIDQVEGMLTELIQQAKREIINWIESRCSALGKYRLAGMEVMPDEWQSFKDKCLKEAKMEEPRPPNCVCCEYMRVCEADRDNGQKVDYCPDPKYRQWLKEVK